MTWWEGVGGINGITRSMTYFQISVNVFHDSFMMKQTFDSSDVKSSAVLFHLVGVCSSLTCCDHHITAITTGIPQTSSEAFDGGMWMDLCSVLAQRGSVLAVSLFHDARLYSVACYVVISFVHSVIPAPSVFYYLQILISSISILIFT